MTQDGIAAALALSRAHVALELKRLKTSGRVQERMAHVAHARSRRKVYELTPAGQEVARRMREHARARTVQLNEPQGVRQVLGSDAIEALRRSGLRESEAVQQVLAADVIELPRPDAPKVPVPSRPFFGRTDERQRLQAWLAAETPSVAILVATRTQPTFYERSDLVAKRVLEVPLGGLDEGASAELLRARGAPIEPDAIQHVIAATHGHPLALELFAASGLDAGAVETERYVLETVLDGLDDSSEELLRTFAVLRRPARSPEALGATLSQLRRLVRRALLHHRDDGYLIHDLVKEFFLRRIGDAARRDAHARAAAYWQFRADGLEETYHRIEAGDIDTARIRLVEIGPGLAESARAGDLEAALLRVPRSPRLDGILVETEVFLGKFAEARAALERIGASGGQLERLRARIQLGRIENRLGAYKEARVVLEEAARDAAAVQSPEIEGEALRALGGVERKLGDLDAAITHLGRATDVLPK